MRYLFVILALLFTISCTKEDPEAKYLQLMNSADQYMQQKKYDEARIELQNAISTKPRSSEAHFKLAQILVRKGNIPRAVENYTSAINFDPDSREPRVHLSSIMVAASQFELAESHINTLLDKNPMDTEALILKANIEGMGPRKNSRRALEILEKVQAREPNNVVVLASRATYELAEENEKESEALFRKALEIDPENSAVKMALSDLYSAQGRLDEAQELMENLVTNNPEASALRYMLGEFLLKRGLADKAYEQYKLTLAKDPDNLSARDRLYDFYTLRKENDKAKALLADLKEKEEESRGIPYFEARNFEIDGEAEKAMGAYIKALNLLTDFGPLYRRLGAIELSKGKVSEAIEHLAQGVSLDPSDAAGRYILARAYFAKGQMTPAAQQLDEVLARYPGHMGANILRADIAVVQDEPERAEKVYEILVETYPDNPIGYFKSAVLEERKGNSDKALSLYKKTLEFDDAVLPPARRLISLRAKQGRSIDEIISEIQELRSNSSKSIAEYDLILGTLHMSKSSEAGQLDKARQYLKSAIAANPKLIGAYFALGALDAIGGDLEAAANNYERLLKRDPTHTPTLMLLALTREKQSNPKAAAEVYDRILKSSPRFAPAANNLAWLLAEEIEGGDLDKALRLAELAKEEIPTEPSAADTLGWVLFKKGNPELARGYIQQALDGFRKANPDGKVNAEMEYHMASILAKVGETDSAKERIKNAIKAAGASHPKLEDMKKLESSL